MKNRLLLSLSLITVLISQNSFAANCLNAYERANRHYVDDATEVADDKLATEIGVGAAAVCVGFSLAFKATRLVAVPCAAVAGGGLVSLAGWWRGDELPSVTSQFKDPSDVYVAYRQLSSNDTKPFANIYKKENYKKIDLTDPRQQAAFNQTFIQEMNNGDFCDANGKTKANIADAVHMALDKMPAVTN